MRNIFIMLVDKMLAGNRTGISLKEAAAFLMFLLSGAGMDSDRRLFLAIMFLIAAAVLYGQAKEKERDEKDNVVENSGAGDCGPGSS